jgi:Zn finger protein HypA/HybF involved in hydrogenase expression
MSDNIDSKNNAPGDNPKQVHGYNRMLERVKETLSGTEEEMASKLHNAVEAAKDKALELGELTREESEEIAEYLKRDIHDAADYLAEEGSEMSDWLRFDMQLVEAKLLDWMSLAVDTTKLEFEQLAERARQENIWLAGEITGPGTLRCTACDHEIQFLETAQIPPCPNCGKKRYKRFSKETE